VRSSERVGRGVALVAPTPVCKEGDAGGDSKNPEMMWESMSLMSSDRLGGPYDCGSELGIPDAGVAGVAPGEASADGVRGWLIGMNSESFLGGGRGSRP
jgi:hypothetical protein